MLCIIHRDVAFADRYCVCSGARIRHAQSAFTENDGDYIGETQEGSERIVVRGEAWFKACRATYSSYESHYTYNSRLEGSSMGYIYGQATCPNFAIGTEYMADVGCEIAATYYV